MEEVLHKIKVNLYENYLTDNPDDFSARVISECTLNVKEICRTAVGRGGAPSTAEAMEHNVMPCYLKRFPTLRYRRWAWAKAVSLFRT